MLFTNYSPSLTTITYNDDETTCHSNFNVESVQGDDDYG